ncbi:hypothetical protein FSARC_12590, partial [Fusarium sarcochroum]
MDSSPVILVTAGSAGLGATVAESFAQSNYRVVINYNSNTDRAEQLRSRLLSQKGVLATDDNTGKCICIRADLGVQEDVQKLVQQTHDAMGRIDVVFSNGGWSRFSDKTSIDDNSVEGDWDRAFNMNVKSHLWLLLATKPWLDETEGSFISTASIAGIQGMGSSLAYGVTKAAQIHMIKALAGMVGPRIRVNSISPGLLLTDWATRFTHEQKTAHREQTKLKRFVRLEDVAQQVLLLAKSKSMT